MHFTISKQNHEIMIPNDNVIYINLSSVKSQKGGGGLKTHIKFQFWRFFSLNYQNFLFLNIIFIFTKRQFIFSRIQLLNLSVITFIQAHVLLALFKSILNYILNKSIQNFYFFTTFYSMMFLFLFLFIFILAFMQYDWTNA